MSGHRVVPSASVHFYSASKYAVTALTEGLRQELREAKTHIRATVRTTGLACACVLEEAFSSVFVSKVSALSPIICYC